MGFAIFTYARPSAPTGVSVSFLDQVARKDGFKTTYPARRKSQIQKWISETKELRRWYQGS